jgi:hypothetical protein
LDALQLPRCTSVEAAGYARMKLVEGPLPGSTPISLQPSNH